MLLNVSDPNSPVLNRIPILTHEIADQARIVGLNAHMFLKDQGGVLISIKASCIDSTAAADVVFSREVQKMREEKIKPKEQLTLEPFERDHCIVGGIYSRSS